MDTSIKSKLMQSSRAITDPFHLPSRNFSNDIPGPSISTNNTTWNTETPLSMPWSTNNSYSQVMVFTGNDCSVPYPCSVSRPRTQVIKFAKRKGLFENEMMPPQKVHITEEHMASQLDSIHISRRFTPHQLCKNAKTEVRRLEEENNGGTQVEGSESPMTSLPSLVVCDEIRRLSAPSILPPSLVAKLESPSKALVLWKPPDPFCSCPIYTVEKLVDPVNNNNNNNKKDYGVDYIGTRRVPLVQRFEDYHCAPPFINYSSSPGSSLPDAKPDTDTSVEDMSVDV